MRLPAARMGEVLRVLMMEGLDVPLARMRVAYCGGWRCRARCTWRRWTGRGESPVPWPVAVRRACVRLGPASVKLGQILSVRTDLIPAKLASELHSLQTDVPPVAFDAIEPILERALGEPVSAWWASCSSSPGWWGRRATGDPNDELDPARASTFDEPRLLGVTDWRWMDA